MRRTLFDVSFSLQQQRQRERERKKRDAEVGCLLLDVFIVAFSGEE